MGRLDKLSKFSLYRSQGSREQTPISDTPSRESSPSIRQRHDPPIQCYPARAESQDKPEVLVGKAAFNLCYVFVTRGNSYQGSPDLHHDSILADLAATYARSAARSREASLTQCKDELFLESVGNDIIQSMEDQEFRVLGLLCEDISASIEKIQRVGYPELPGNTPTSPFPQRRNNTRDTLSQTLDRRASSSASSSFASPRQATPIKTEDAPSTPLTGRSPLPPPFTPPAPVTPTAAVNDCRLCSSPMTVSRSQNRHNGNHRRPYLKCQTCNDGFRSWTDRVGVYDDNPDCDCSPPTRSRLQLSFKNGTENLFYSCAKGECRFYQTLGEEDRTVLLGRLRTDLARGRNTDWR